MKIFSRILMLAALTSVMYSCETDVDDSDLSQTPKEVVMSYSYSNTADFFELMNVSVEYMDAEGSLIKRDITENWKYEATVPYSSAPVEFKFSVTYSSAVTELEQPKEQYTLQGSFIGSVYKVFPDGSTMNVVYDAMIDNSPKNFSGENINDYLSLRYNNPFTYGFTCPLNE